MKICGVDRLDQNSNERDATAANRKKKSSDSSGHDMFIFHIKSAIKF